MREVTYAVGNHLGALGAVEHSVFVKEVVHIAALQLSYALLLRHAVIEFIHLGVDVGDFVVAACQSYSRTHYCSYLFHVILIG